MSNPIPAGRAALPRSPAINPAPDILAALIKVPWSKGGRTFAGADCVGIVRLYAHLTDRPIPKITTPPESEITDATVLPLLDSPPGGASSVEPLPEGTLLFFVRQGRLCHVAVTLGRGRILHSTMAGPRIDNGPELLRRLGFELVGTLPITDSARVTLALRHAGLANPVQIIVMLVISIGLSLISGALMGSPRVGLFGGSRYGSFDGLVTKNSGEVAIPDVLGQVAVAGNAVYQERLDQNVPGSVADTLGITRIVVFGEGGIDGFDQETLRIGGYTYDGVFHFDGTADGFALNPAQTKAEAYTGTIGSDTLRSSVTLYETPRELSPTLDVRMANDRTAPLWGFNRSAHAWFRVFNPQKYASGFNVTLRVRGAKCRDFDSSGWLTTTVTAESLAGADGTLTRWLLANGDLLDATLVEVNGNPYTEVSATNQTGDVYHLNRTLGIIEFLTAPPAAAVIEVTYDYYPRTHTRNPARLIAWVLTEPIRGKGYGEGSIDWPSFDTARDYFDETVPTGDGQNVIEVTRYQCDYVIDARRPLTDHLDSLKQACRSELLLTGGLVKLKPLQNGDSFFSFTEDNIVAGTFRAEQPDRSGSPNRVRLQFQDAAAINSESAVLAEDPADQADRSARIGNNGVVEMSAKYLAVTDRSQAFRLAHQILADEVQRLWVGQHTTTEKGLALEPGDIIDITHPAQPGWDERKARVTDLEFDEMGRLVVKWIDYVELPFA
jgi:hypothetical protein